jgi:hypothetical protein
MNKHQSSVTCHNINPISIDDRISRWHELSGHKIVLFFDELLYKLNY